MQKLFMFSGQGAQYVGMGRDLAVAIPEIKATYDEAAEILGYDLLDLTEEELSKTEFAQPATFTHSLAIWYALPAELRRGAALAGFSLGEYSALTASGMLPFAQGLQLVKERAIGMQEACEQNSGAMFAIVGLEDKDIEHLLSEIRYKDLVWPVNYNSPGQLVIAGETEAAESAASELKSMGAKLVQKLNVSGAFHTVLMEPAARRTASWAETNITTLGLTDNIIYSNSDGHRVPFLNITNLPAYLARHMTSPVRWHQSMNQAAGDGVQHFIELGPGKVLRKLLTRTLKGMDMYNVDTVKDYNELLTVEALYGAEAGSSNT